MRSPGARARSFCCRHRSNSKSIAALGRHSRTVSVLLSRLGRLSGCSETLRRTLPKSTNVGLRSSRLRSCPRSPSGASYPRRQRNARSNLRQPTLRRPICCHHIQHRPQQPKGPDRLPARGPLRPSSRFQQTATFLDTSLYTRWRTSSTKHPCDRRESIARRALLDALLGADKAALSARSRCRLGTGRQRAPPATARPPRGD
jgi:hypothetical protein